MRRIRKSRCTTPSALPVEIGGGYPQAMARCLYTPLSERAHKGRKVTYAWFAWRPILVTASTYIETVVAESCPLFRVLRHRASSSPIYFSEVIRFSLRLIARIPLIQRREKCPSREEKSAFPQWLFRIYVRSLKDQVRKSKYPRT